MPNLLDAIVGGFLGLKGSQESVSGEEGGAKGKGAGQPGKTTVAGQRPAVRETGSSIMRQFGPGQKRPRPADTHSTLEPDYRNPKDAVNIDMPGSASRTFPNGPNKIKPGKQRHMPMNTLDRQQPAKVSTGRYGASRDHMGGQLDVRESKGANVPNSRNANGFWSAEDAYTRRQAKKRKIDDGIIDLGDEDEERQRRQETEKEESQHSTISIASGSSAQQSDPLTSATAPQLSQANGMRRMAKRPGPGEGGSLIKSGQTPFHRQIKGIVEIPVSGSNRKRTENAVRVQTDGNTSKRQKTAPDSGEPPPILLDKGFFDISNRSSGRISTTSDFTQTGPERVSENDSDPLNRSYGHAHAMVKEQARAALQKNHRSKYEDSPAKARQQNEGRKKCFVDLSSPEKANGHDPPHPPVLHHPRPQTEATKPKSRLKEGMQEKSTMQRATATAFESDSADELAGAPTVGSNAIFKSQRVSQSPGRAIRKSSPRKSSPPLFPRTEFIASPRHPSVETSKRTPLAALSKATGRGCDPADVIELAAFHCSAFCLEQESLQLTWDRDLDAFYICVNGVKRRLPGRDKLATLGSKDVNKWCTSSDGLVVRILGPKNELSRGQILILFKDKEGKQTCHDRLAWGIWQIVSTDAILKIYNNQLPEIRQQHAFAMKESKLPLVDEEHKSKIRQDAHDEEQIIYEDDELETRRPARVNRPRETAEESPYFPSALELEQDRRSTRQFRPFRLRTPSPIPVSRWTEVHKPKRWAQSVVYPPKGARRTTVDFQDLERLDEGEFLNDNIIGFALRRIEEQMAPEHKEKVHFFNTYFYTALSTKNGRKSFNYDAVKKWTKNQDLLSTPYIVVPINHDLHWFVAIICNLPNIDRKAGSLDDPCIDSEPPISETKADVRTETSSAALVVPDSQENDKTAENTTEKMDELSLHDQPSSPARSQIFKYDDDGGVLTDTKDEAQDFVTASQTSNTSNAKKRRKGRLAPPVKKYDPEMPSIITLDSFGTAHTGEVAFLKDYVIQEAQEKRNTVITRADLQGITAKGVPEQTNFCDCGLFVVGYLEAFAKNPRQFVEKVLSKQLDAKNDFAAFDASIKRNELRDALISLHQKQGDDRQAAKKKKLKAAAKDNGRGANAGVASSPPIDPAAASKSDAVEKGEPTATEPVEGVQKDLNTHQAHGSPQPEFPSSPPVGLSLGPEIPISSLQQDPLAAITKPSRSFDRGTEYNGKAAVNVYEDKDELGDSDQRAHSALFKVTEPEPDAQNAEFVPLEVSEENVEGVVRS